ncbi:hypothetical protein F4778DRAFT_208666 [Xylariomycetidae sp. FL2044]|nr:hypothetical protein F4778DRAFT_208666 [Xylariomycetidae sp. FL2044]
MSDNVMYDTDDTRPLITLDTPVGLFVVLRGFMRITEESEERLSRPPYGMTIRIAETAVPGTFKLPDRVEAKFRGMRARAMQMPSMPGYRSPSPGSTASPTDAGDELELGHQYREPFLDAIKCLETLQTESLLRQCEAHMLETSCFDDTFFWKWMACIADLFTSALPPRQPLALQIMGKFSSILDSSRQRGTGKAWQEIHALWSKKSPTRARTYRAAGVGTSKGSLVGYAIRSTMITGADLPMFLGPGACLVEQMARSRTRLPMTRMLWTFDASFDISQADRTEAKGDLVDIHG